MKTIIAGGRDYVLTSMDRSRLDGLRLILPITEVVSGCATGADKGGEEWAKSRGIHVERFWPEWNRYGPSAGPRRNSRMAKYADACVLFPGGRGTADMEVKARQMGLNVVKFPSETRTEQNDTSSTKSPRRG